MENLEIEKKDIHSILNDTFMVTKEKIFPVIISVKRVPELMEYFNSSNYSIEFEEFLDKIITLIEESPYISIILNQNKSISLFEILIKRYFEFSDKNNNQVKSKISKLLTIMLSNIDCPVTVYNFIFRQISSLYRLKKEELTKDKMNQFLSILSIFYGKEVKKTIPYNYFYFSSSGKIEVSVENLIPDKIKEKKTSSKKNYLQEYRPKTSNENKFRLSYGFCALMWIFLEFDQVEPFDLVDMNMDAKSRRKTSNNQTLKDVNVKLSVTKEKEIQILINGKNINEEEHIYLTPRVWTQIKFVIKPQKLIKPPKFIFFKKELDQPVETFSKPMILDEFCCDQNVKSLTLLNNFYGRVTSILVFNNHKIFHSDILNTYIEKEKESTKKVIKDNNDKMLNYPYGVYKEKIFYGDFLKDEGLRKKVIFAFVPFQRYITDEGIIIIDNFFRHSCAYIKTYNSEVQNANGINLYHSFMNNIFFLGGINNLLPIAEIIFTEYNQLMTNANVNDNIFRTYIYLLKLILLGNEDEENRNKKNKNAKEAASGAFFLGLNIFLEKMPKHLFTKELFEIFVKLIRKITQFSPKYIHAIILNKLFYCKFSVESQIIIWKTLIDYTEFLSLSQILPIIKLYDDKKFNEYCCKKHSEMFVLQSDDHRVIMEPTLIEKCEGLFTIIGKILEEQSNENTMISLLEFLCLELSPCIQLKLLQILNKFLGSEKIKEMKLDFLKIKDISLIAIRYLITKCLLDVKVELIRYITLLNERCIERSQKSKNPIQFLSNDDYQYIRQNIFFGNLKFEEDLNRNGASKKQEEKITYYQSKLEFNINIPKAPATSKNSNKKTIGFTTLFIGAEKEIPPQINDNQEKEKIKTNTPLLNKKKLPELNLEQIEQDEDENRPSYEKPKSTRESGVSLKKDGVEDLLPPSNYLRKSAIVGKEMFNRDSMKLDTDEINREASLNEKNFDSRVFSLSKHCVDFSNDQVHAQECKKEYQENYEDSFDGSNDGSCNSSVEKVNELDPIASNNVIDQNDKIEDVKNDFRLLIDEDKQIYIDDPKKNELTIPNNEICKSNPENENLLLESNQEKSLNKETNSEIEKSKEKNSVKPLQVFNIEKLAEYSKNLFEIIKKWYAKTKDPQIFECLIIYCLKANSLDLSQSLLTYLDEIKENEKTTIFHSSAFPQFLFELMYQLYLKNEKKFFTKLNQMYSLLFKSLELLKVILNYWIDYPIEDKNKKKITTQNYIEYLFEWGFYMKKIYLIIPHIKSSINDVYNFVVSILESKEILSNFSIDIFKSSKDISKNKLGFMKKMHLLNNLFRFSCFCDPNFAIETNRIKNVQNFQILADSLYEKTIFESFAQHLEKKIPHSEKPLNCKPIDNYLVVIPQNETTIILGDIPIPEKEIIIQLVSIDKSENIFYPLIKIVFLLFIHKLNKSKLEEKNDSFKKNILLYQYFILFCIKLTTQDDCLNSYEILRDIFYINFSFLFLNGYDRQIEFSEENKKIFRTVLGQISNIIAHLIFLIKGNKDKKYKLTNKNILIEYDKKLTDKFKSSLTDLLGKIENGNDEERLRIIEEIKEKITNSEIFSLELHFFNDKPEQNSKIDKSNKIKVQYEYIDDKVVDKKLGNDIGIKFSSNTQDSSSDSYKKDHQIVLERYNTELIKEKERKEFTIKKNRKKYKTIKKELFSWNNGWSDWETFFTTNGKQCLKYKILNHFSQNLMRPLLTPILDINYYIPKFSGFDKENLFDDEDITKTNDTSQNDNENENKDDNKINPNSFKDIYSISLDFDTILSANLEKENEIKLSNEKENYIKQLYSTKEKEELFHSDTNVKKKEKNEKNETNYLTCCFLRQTHHIRGKIKLSSKKIEFFAFPPDTKYDQEDVDYDEDRKTCFGSIFSIHQKDKNMSVFELPFEDIKLALNRKYFYRNTGLEIYTYSNKNYYFKFRTKKERNSVYQFLNKNKHFPLVIKDKTIGYLYTEYDKPEKFFPFYPPSNLVTNWKNWKISNFAFIMWLNIFSGRSYRDLTQYPVMPWIVVGTEKVKNSNSHKKPKIKIRNLKLPIGMLDDPNKEAKGESVMSRKMNYINNYNMMIEELRETLGITEDGSDILTEEPQGDIQKKEFLMNEKLFNNPKLKEVELEKIPYYYGSHYSNPIYVNHFLLRLFPYSNMMIEMQGNKFDDPQRLFISIKNTFASATSQKCDVRELIPEFYYLPEMFKNINKLKLGYAITEIGKDNEVEKTFKINDVLLPKWAKGSPYRYVAKLTNKLNKQNGISHWIDLIFGYKQRGKEARFYHNVFLPFSYDGVVKLKKCGTKDKKNIYLRMVELGVTPSQILFSVTSEKDISSLPTQFELIKNKEVNYIIKKCIILSESSCYFDYKKENLFVIYNDYTWGKSQPIKEKQDNLTLDSKFDMNFSDNIKVKLFKMTKYHYYIYPESSVHHTYLIYEKDNKIIIGGLFDGSLIESSTGKEAVDHYLLFSKEEVKKNSKEYLKRFDYSPIVYLVMNKDENSLFCGTQNGSIINLRRKPKSNWEFTLSKQAHTKAISSLYINEILNVLASSSYDGYVHLYTLPNVKLFRSIYIENFTIDYTLISASPVPCIVVYSKKIGKFKVFGINGNSIEIKKSKKDEANEKEGIIESKSIYSPFIYTSYNFCDYLIYGNNKGEVVIKKLPFLKTKIKSNIQCDNSEIEIEWMKASEDKKICQLVGKKMPQKDNSNNPQGVSDSSYFLCTLFNSKMDSGPIGNLKNCGFNV